MKLFLDILKHEPVTCKTSPEMQKKNICFALIFCVAESVADSVEEYKNMEEFGASLIGFRDKVKIMEDRIGNFTDRSARMMSKILKIILTSIKCKPRLYISNARPE